MRDIRSDLQERATLIDDQIRAAYSHFEKTVEHLRNEHDARVADLKSDLTLVAKFMEFEGRHFRSDPAQGQSSVLLTLADLFMHRLAEVGPDVERGASRAGCEGGVFRGCGDGGSERASHACQFVAQRADT